MSIFEKAAELADDAWDRGFEVARGPARGVKSFGDLVADLAQAPFTDDEYGGFLATLYDATIKRLGQAAGGMFGPDTGLGAALGAIPQGVRDIGDEPLEGFVVGAGAGSLGGPAGILIGGAAGLLYGATGRSAFEDSETIYREGIGEPLTTALSAASLADAPGGGGVGGLLRPENWRRAYRIAQDRSPGQALALAMGTKNIMDPKEVEQFAGTEAYRIWSGMADAVFRMTLDPTVLGGKAVKAARGLYIAEDVATGARSLASRTLRSTSDIEKARNSVSLANVAEKIDAIKTARGEGAAAMIRHQLFSDHAHGDMISTVLAQAPDTTKALGALMGRMEDYTALTQDAPGIAHRIRNLTVDATESARRSAGVMSEELDTIYRELDDLYPQAEHMDRLTAGYQGGVLDEVPRYSKLGELRARATLSDFYQKDALTAPIRKVTNMVPGHWLNLNDQTHDIKIARQMRDSLLDEDAQLTWRSRYMAAATPAAKQKVAIDAEEAAVRSVLEHHGIHSDDIEKVLSQSRKHRSTAMGALKKRQYDGLGRGSKKVEEIDGSFTDVHLPLHVTQQADLLPLVDMKAVRRVAEQLEGAGLNGRWQRFREGTPITDLPVDVMEGFYKLWRPATLLRVGWPARVLSDEQMRIIAAIGSMTQVKALAKGLGNNLVERKRGLPAMRNATPEQIAAGGVRRKIGYRDVVLDDGTVMPPAYGPPGDAANALEQANSSAGTFREMMGGSESALLEELRQGTGEFKSYRPGERDYEGWWEHSVNRQIGQSAFARKALEGLDEDAMVDWLARTAEGRAYARQMDWRPHTFEAHARDVRQQVHSYIPSRTLRETLLQRELTIDDLNRLPTSIRPTVHGEDIAQSLGTSTLSKLVRNTVAKAWRGLGQHPTDVLSRNPYFDSVYRAEVQRLVNIHGENARLAGRVLDDGDKAAIAASARRKALTASKELLYDLAEKSEFAEMLRFISPFYMAWQEVITRWAGLAIDNPAFAARARMVWNSPEKMGIVTDENGYYIDENGVARDPVTDKVVPKDRVGSERFIQVPFGIPGLPTKGGVRFNKKSLNLALTGTPGVGPVVQIPVNEIVKKAPELEESVKFILPFGTTQSTLEMVLPATAKRAFALAEGNENRMLANQTLRIYFDRMTDFERGKRPDLEGLSPDERLKKLYGEAKDAARDLYKIRVFASYISPFAPVFDSPYQPYINAYRNAQERLRNEEAPFGRHPDGEPISVDDWFIDTHGEEYFYLTQSLSKSMDGIAPTLEGYDARERFKDLIEKHPDMGGLIVGDADAGEFARAVYDMQLSSPLKPGSGLKQRETYSFEEGAEQPEVRLGWIKYGRAMDLIDAAASARGLPNLQVKAAAPLAALKRAITEKLAAEFPAWAEEFYVQDSQRWDRRLEALREIAADKRLNIPARQDLVGLRAYLKARDSIVALLATRESKTLTASSNAEVAALWSSVRAALVERHVAFAPLFYRYLERDPLEG